MSLELIGSTSTLQCNGIQGDTTLVNIGQNPLSMTADANVTLGNFSGLNLLVTSTLSLTATRNVVLPLVAGCIVFVENLTSGSQSLQFIGATGTGITVATGKRAMLGCDGTNWNRFGPDQ